MKFSKLVAGTMSWGAWGRRFNSLDMQRQIENTVGLGISTFDHADIYGGYTTESAFGAAFSKTNISRSRIQLISKCGIQLQTPNRSNRLKHYDCSKNYIISSAEASLKHLKTDYLDLLLIHRPSPLMDPHDIMEAVQYLKKEGKIINFGVSNFTPSQVELLASEVPVAVNQIEFSVTEYSALHNGALDQMIVDNITPMAWSPLGAVFKSSTAQTKRVHKCLDVLTSKYNVTKDQLLLAWILKHPAQIHPVIGTTTKERVIAANNAITIELELEDWFELLIASQGHKVP